MQVHMALSAALGDGPIVFFTNQGQQIQVPLSAIHFENGKVGTTRTDLGADFLTWITYLASRGRLVASASPPPLSSLVVTAAEPGASGDNIELTVTPNADPALVDVRV